MSVIETFNKTINREKPECILTYDVLMNNRLYEMYSEGKGTIVEKQARMMKNAGLDITRLIYDPAEHWLDAKVKCWEDNFGIGKGGFTVTSGGSTKWLSRRPFTDMDGFKRNLPQMPDKDRVAQWYIPMLREIKKVFDDSDLVFIGETEGPLTDSYDFMDMELFCTALYDSPDEVNYLLDVTTEWARIIIELYCEYPTSAAFLLGDDIAYKTGTVFSPGWLKKNIYGRWKKLLRPLKEAGIKCLYHSDGNLYEVLDDLVYDVGIEGLNPIEPAAGMDIVRIRNSYPDLLLLGNIDTMGVLLNGSPLEVDEAVKKLIGEIGYKGGLFVGSSTEVSDAVPVENIFALYGAVHKYGKMYN